MIGPCGIDDCDCDQTIEKLVKALKVVEWTGESRDADYCPACLRDDCAGHADDCVVGIALTAVAAPEPCKTCGGTGCRNDQCRDNDDCPKCLGSGVQP